MCFRDDVPARRLTSWRCPRLGHCRRWTQHSFFGVKAVRCKGRCSCVVQLPAVEMLPRVHTGLWVIARLRKQPVQACGERKFWRLCCYVRGCQSSPAGVACLRGQQQRQAGTCCLVLLAVRTEVLAAASGAPPPPGVLCRVRGADREPLACLPSGGSKLPCCWQPPNAVHGFQVAVLSNYSPDTT